MKTDPLESEIKGFYEDLAPPDERIDALLQMRAVAARTRTWRRIALTAAASLLAMTSIAGYLWIHNQRTIEPPSIVTPEQDEQPQSEVAQEQRNDTPDPADTGVDFRLVAIKKHGDRCPRCRQAAATLANLQPDFAGQRLLFVNVDLSDPDQADQTRLLTEALGLSDLVDNYEHTGQIFLVKSDGSIVDILEGSSDKSLLVERISGHLRTSSEIN